MDDPRVLRIITVGLILAALAVGYFLLTGGLGPKKVQTQKTQLNKVVTSPIPSAAPNEIVSQSQTATQSAYSRILSRTQSNVQTLPNTGFPAGLVLVFSASAIISGWSLSKYPN